MAIPYSAWEILAGSNFFLQMGLIFTNEGSKTAPPTLPVGSTYYCTQPNTCEMTHELHTLEAIICVYNIYEEIWYAAEVLDHPLRDQLIDRAITAGA